MNGVSPSDPPGPGFFRTGGYFPNGWRREENTFNHEDLNSPPTEVTGVEAHGDIYEGDIYQTLASQASKPNSSDQ